MAAKKPAASKPKKSGVKEASDKPKKLLNGGVDPAVGKATQFQPGESGNPEGRPKGSLSLSTHIQNLLNDEEFTATIRRGLQIVEFKGAPIKAIIAAQAIKALNGEEKAFDLLAKYGYGTKVEVSGPDGGPIPALVEFVESGDSDSDTSTD